MVYYGAVTEGSIVFGSCGKDVMEGVEKYIFDNVADCVFREDGERLVFSGGSIRYSDGLFRELFEKIGKACTEGEIRICGEDWKVWCFRYDASEGCWKKHIGVIVYSDGGEKV